MDEIDLSATFDFQHPVYAPIIEQRARRLALLRNEPDVLEAARLHYRDNLADFINHWGWTADPRNAERGLPVLVPFILFPKQREWIDWILARWRAQEPGITEKSRDGGLSWLATSLACSLSIWRDGIVIGFGSRKEEYVDKLGAPKSLFYKARLFMRMLPPEFNAGWGERNAPHMRIDFPKTGSVITGEAGDNIGRGDRASIYLVDESAHLEHPELIDASLSATTNCRQDISSVNGMANPFAVKRHGGKIKVFTFSWRDDPRKNQAWYDKQVAELDPVVVAQEIDINYSASVEGIVIPSLWVSAAVDAHIKLGLKITGAKSGSLDVADRGIDKNAFVVRHGILVPFAESWSGKGSDIFATTERAFNYADTYGLPGFNYDGDGLGAGVRGDARKLNEARAARGGFKQVEMFRGSAGVFDPERIVPGTDRKAEDFFANLKAQSWWALRFRFQATYKAVVQGRPFNPDEIISIASDFPERGKLIIELSQPVYKLQGAGKIIIDKQPDGVASPNLADAVMMAFAPRRPPMVISDELLEESSRAT